MMEWDEVRVLDINSEYQGYSTETLMENAGWAVAAEITSRFGSGNRIAIICGTGNNGGDGFVVARHLTAQNIVKVILATPPDKINTSAARINFEKVEELHKVYNNDDLTEYDILVDALLGVGFRGEMRDRYSEIVGRINASGRTIVSVDVPSGLGSSVVVNPTITITFNDLKVGMDASSCGEILVKDIGIPKEVEKYLGPGEFVHYPIPQPDSYKGQNGRVLIVGGGPYIGAPVLAALAAYRIGADLVWIATPETAYPSISCQSPNIIAKAMPGSVMTEGNLDILIDLMKRSDAILIGPGLGRDERTMAGIRALIKECSIPMVLDADAFAAIGTELELLRGKRGILTPHAKELSVLRGSGVDRDATSRENAAKDIALRSGMTVVAKGKVDVVTDGNWVKWGRTGNAGMSVGGTGDVLAGICAGLLAKGVEPYRAARIAAFTNGSAGDLAFEKYSYGLVASDLLERIPLVLRKSLDRLR